MKVWPEGEPVRVSAGSAWEGQRARGENVDTERDSERPRLGMGP